MKSIVFSILFFSTNSLFSQVITHSTNDTIILDLQNPFFMDEKIDINQDGINEFSLYLSGVNNDPNAWFAALTDSTDILHEYKVEGNWSGYKAVNQTDSVIDENSNWMVIAETQPFASAGAGFIHSTFADYVPQFLNETFYTGVRFYIEGGDFISRFHYGCINATVTLDERVIIHSWSYNATPEQSITCSDEFLNENASLEVNNQNQLNIYPNPNYTNTFKTNVVLNKVIVYNRIGEEIKVDIFDQTFSFSKDTPQGVYFVLINDVYERKIVIL